MLGITLNPMIRTMNSTKDFAATIGLDWADQKHDLWIQPARGSSAQHLRLDHTPEALHLWVATLRKRFDNAPVAIGIETSRGPVISALMAYDFIVIFPINPKALKDYRRAFSVSGAKDDRSDAQLAEEFVRLHRHKLYPLEPDIELTRRLAGLVERRRGLVDERTRLVNRLHDVLKTYYPLAESFLGRQIKQPMAADFLARWPRLDRLQKAQPKTLRAFFYKHNCRSTSKIQKFIAQVPLAQPLTTDSAIIIPAVLLVKALVGMLKVLHRSIEELDQHTQEVMDQHPEAPIFRSFPGAGPALAPRLLVAFGTNRDRFQNPDEVAQFYGVAPVTVQSGNTKITHFRHRCPKFGRQTFHENAACALNQEPWAKAYYLHHKQRHEGKHHQACRALAFKLNRIYFACWKNREPYDPQRYLKALQDNGSPLYSALSKTQPKTTDQISKTPLPE